MPTYTPDSENFWDVPFDNYVLEGDVFVFGTHQSVVTKRDIEMQAPVMTVGELLWDSYDLRRVVRLVPEGYKTEFRETRLDKEVPVQGGDAVWRYSVMDKKFIMTLIEDSKITERRITVAGVLAQFPKGSYVTRSMRVIVEREDRSHLTEKVETLNDEVGSW